jgi:hypothetical protein
LQTTHHDGDELQSFKKPQLNLILRKPDPESIRCKKLDRKVEPALSSIL